MPTLANTFSGILADLRAAVAAYAARAYPVAPVADRHRARCAMFVLLWSRLARIATRFETLFTRWQAGALPKPRPSQAGQPRAPRKSPRFPAGRAWLVAQVREAAAGASQLQYLLARPDFGEFLAAAPQAGRILRPLCRMLGIHPVPEPLRLPARPRAPRPPRPPPAPKIRIVPFRRPRLPPIIFPDPPRRRSSPA